MSIRFNELPIEEQEILFLTPAKAAVLVGGADENFDEIEQKVATELTRIKSYNSKGELKDFYSLVSDRFVQDINNLMEIYPETAKERNDIIKEELTKVSPILEKLGDGFKTTFINIILELARHVAEASGGILWLLTINHDERKEIENLTKILK